MTYKKPPMKYNLGLEKYEVDLEPKTYTKNPISEKQSLTALGIFFGYSYFNFCNYIFIYKICLIF